MRVSGDSERSSDQVRMGSEISCERESTAAGAHTGLKARAHSASLCASSGGCGREKAVRTAALSAIVCASGLRRGVSPVSALYR